MNSFSLRIASPSDAEALLAVYVPYILDTAITFETELPSLEEFRGRIEKTLQQYPYLVAEDESGIVGYTYASPFKTRAAYDWSCETSIYVRMGLHRRGIGKALYQALEEALNMQGIQNVNACIAYPAVEDEYLTRDSVRFHEHLGYRMVGQFHSCACKFERWYDMVWMERSIGKHPLPPPAFVPFPAIRSVFERELR